MSSLLALKVPWSSADGIRRVCNDYALDVACAYAGRALAAAACARPTEDVVGLGGADGCSPLSYVARDDGVRVGSWVGFVMLLYEARVSCDYIAYWLNRRACGDVTSDDIRRLQHVTHQLFGTPASNGGQPPRLSLMLAAAAAAVTPPTAAPFTCQVEAPSIAPVASPSTASLTCPVETPPPIAVTPLACLIEAPPDDHGVAIHQRREWRALWRKKKYPCAPLAIKRTSSRLQKRAASAHV